MHGGEPSACEPLRRLLYVRHNQEPLVPVRLVRKLAKPVDKSKNSGLICASLTITREYPEPKISRMSDGRLRR
jgi:hypothetical protein